MGGTEDWEKTGLGSGFEDVGRRRSLEGGFVVEGKGGGEQWEESGGVRVRGVRMGRWLG